MQVCGHPGRLWIHTTGLTGLLDEVLAQSTKVGGRPEKQALLTKRALAVPPPIVAPFPFPNTDPRDFLDGQIVLRPTREMR